MIPNNIKREHITKAIEKIKNNEIPKRKNSTKYLLEFNGGYYPPKYVISLANKHANGKILDPTKFNGGKETNDFLRKLGFNIIDVSAQKKVAKFPKAKKSKKLPNTHAGERCPRCKETIKRLLEKIYGEVRENYKFNVGTHPEDFKGTLYYNELKEIYGSLQNNRGFKDFAKAKTLPNCDFYVVPKPKQKFPGFIVEFDESQHFTLPRKIALEKYPSDLKLGFNREKWIKLCKKIKAKDNDPPYRDEQRAWYDTLRDFLPAILGLKPTVRLFSKDFVWCSLDPENPEDVRRFKRMIEGQNEPWEIEIKKDENPFIARAIIADKWNGKPECAKKLLEEVCDKWPEGVKVNFLMTCGGFIQFNWPDNVSKKDIGDPKDPNPEAVNTLVREAEKYVKEKVLTEDLRNKLKEVTDYVTLGVDSYKEKISTTSNYIGQPHIELVFLIDLKNDKFYWTGKSYPTTGQEKGLVRITDLSKHFFDLDDVGKVMILGCHDLNIFNPRSKNAKGWRKKVNGDFVRLAQRETPKIVLHHPHTTVKFRTWQNAWRSLKNTLPSVEVCASAGRYYEPDREKYDKLDDVLEHTKCGNTIDFIIKVEENCNQEANLDSNSGLPEDVEQLLKVLGELESSLDKNTIQKGEDIVGKISGKSANIGNNINVIPDGIPGNCEKILVVAIGLNDDIEQRVSQAVEHVTKVCPEITKYVVFWATKWNSVAWAKYCNVFKNKNITVLLKLFNTGAIIL
jgi:hypothetical protein